MNNCPTAAERLTHDNAVSRMSDALPYTERAIVAYVVLDALAAGYSVSVCDDYTGEGEWTVKRSTDAAVILAALGTTGGDTLRFRDASGASVGVVVFIYGNGRDVIHDYTDNEALAAILRNAEAMADRS